MSPFFIISIIPLFYTLYLTLSVLHSFSDDPQQDLKKLVSVWEEEKKIATGDIFLRVARLVLIKFINAIGS